MTCELTRLGFKLDFFFENYVAIRTFVMNNLIGFDLESLIMVMKFLRNIRNYSVPCATDEAQICIFLLIYT